MTNELATRRLAHDIEQSLRHLKIAEWLPKSVRVRMAEAVLADPYFNQPKEAA